MKYNDIILQKETTKSDRERYYKILQHSYKISFFM
jgi:hypothetical protein